jgi:hypothetical protein
MLDSFNRVINLPFEEKYNKINSIIVGILFLYTIVQLIFWADPNHEIPAIIDNLVTGFSFTITVLGYMFYTYKTAGLDKVYITNEIEVKKIN